MSPVMGGAVPKVLTGDADTQAGVRMVRTGSAPPCKSFNAKDVASPMRKARIQEI
jgi:hypothetical protein